MIEQDNYKCKYGLYHDKPVHNKEPSSNNGFIYTAYAKHLLPNTIDYETVSNTFNACRKSNNPLKITRLPGMEFPVMSKDEVIGAVSLGLLHDEELQNSHYNFCSLDAYQPKPLSFGRVLKALRALYGIRKEHRNYIWQNEVVDGYALAFRLMPWDTYYTKKMAGKSTSVLEKVSFYLDFLFTVFGDNKSTKMMLWLKLEDLKHPLRKLTSKKKYVKLYFRPGHVFRKILGV